jgi:hypothetical protein
MFDHGTGIVVGETAKIGDECSLLHGVTLGGTGKRGGRDRHPKLGNQVSDCLYLSSASTTLSATLDLCPCRHVVPSCRVVSCI